MAESEPASLHDRMIEAMSSTGYLLEYDCCNMLSQNGWLVINNRYYVDDVTGQQREMDILAYRARTVETVEYYTVLIVSCKKNSASDCVFVTKPAQEKDPNRVNYPTSIWTNSRVLSFMLKQRSLEREIQSEMFLSDFLEHIYERNRDIFAFQLVSKGNCKPQDDRAIYDSIITSAKALNYEREALASRKRSKAFYTFHLVTVFRGDMLELRFDRSGNSTAHEIDEIKYCNRHIINKREEHYTVHFVKDTRFLSLLKSFGSLHEWLAVYASRLVSSYYSKFYEYEGGIALFEGDIKPGLIQMINHRLQELGHNRTKSNFVHLEFDKTKGAFIVDPFVTNSEAMESLKNDESLKTYVRKEFENYYHFRGEVLIDDVFFE